MLPSAQSVPNQQNSLSLIPTTPGVYIFRDELDNPLYIGKAKNLKSRLSSYYSKSLLRKTARMVSDAKKVSYIEVGSELEALLLEARLVRKHKPKFNSELRDDKHPLYIVITKDEYPKILTTRKIDEKETKQYSVYYGPFPNSIAVRSVLRLLRRVFPYSTHKIGKRPCLYSQIGLCYPCPNFIESLTDSEKESPMRQYKNNIRYIKKILNGKITNVRRDLQTQMKSFSDSERYEDAHQIKLQIDRLDYVTQSPTSIDAYIKNPNFIQDMRSHEVDSLQKILADSGLTLTKLNRIECYDIAHLSGSSPTASMVVFTNGASDTKEYRHFKIYQTKSRSDVDSLRETIKRRLRHLDDWGIPDLIVVDGGKPQVSVFLEELSGTGIPVIGIAKRFETLIIPVEQRFKSKYVEYRLQKGPAKFLIERMRNEAHRFSRRYHHMLLKKELLSSG